MTTEVAIAGLVVATAAGDRQAFARLYELTAPHLFAIAMRMVRRRDKAEDILQEAYLAIWRKALQYRPEKGAPLPWMATIVRHRVIDHLRSEKDTTSELSPWQEDDAADPVDRLGHAGPEPGVTRELTACLEQLAVGQRKAIVLAYCYGLTHQELARRLSCPVGTVKSWVRRGLMQLKDCLDR